MHNIIENIQHNNAIILAAGYGMRMVPINTEIPKALLKVNGERLIERLIKQLHDVGIFDITIVVGFMKEQFEYLEDKYNVSLIINDEYNEKNNLHSLCLAADKLNSTYIVPCDIWCEINPFSANELNTWYMVSTKMVDESTVALNNSRQLISVPKSVQGNRMIGICHIASKDAEIFKCRLRELDEVDAYQDAFWEEALFYDDEQKLKNTISVASKVIADNSVYEINTYEQLRELDNESTHLKSDAIDIISDTLHVDAVEITNITVLKKGMTNRSFLFQCKGRKYIMRIPGEGTEKLINRREEASVYKIIAGKDLCDSLVYINPDNGYKITEFLECTRVCNPLDNDDLKRCMDKLRAFHRLKLQVSHEFDVYKQIDFYESLWQGSSSIYEDYGIVKNNVLSLKPFVEKNIRHRILCHIDANHDNFLFYRNIGGSEDLRLIDWEYAGMQDSDIDIAMFCIYALYDRMQIDKLIDIYYKNQCSEIIRIKIYCYIAICGLLWSNWCEYKKQLGIEFGEYALKQYQYAKDYYYIVVAEMKKEGIVLE